MAAKSTNEDIRRSNRLKLIWGLVALIGPTALIVISLLAYAVVNFLFSTVEPAHYAGPGIACTDDPAAGVCASDMPVPGGDGLAKTIINVVLFFTGALSVITWLPGIIVGIILLAARKPVPQQ